MSQPATTAKCPTRLSTLLAPTALPASTSSATTACSAATARFPAPVPPAAPVRESQLSRLINFTRSLCVWLDLGFREHGLHAMHGHDCGSVGHQLRRLRHWSNHTRSRRVPECAFAERRFSLLTCPLPGRLPCWLIPKWQRLHKLHWSELHILTLCSRSSVSIARSIAAAPALTQCTACLAGQVSDVTRTICNDCPAATFQTGNTCQVRIYSYLLVSAQLS